jgi:hypothetical protein
MEFQENLSRLVDGDIVVYGDKKMDVLIKRTTNS